MKTTGRISGFGLCAWLLPLCLIFLCLSANGLFAQPNIDSLRQVAKELPQDTNSIRKLVEITQELRMHGQAEAEDFGKMAVAMAVALGEVRWRGEALGALGTVYQVRSNYDEALSTLLEADKAFTEVGYEMGLAKVYVNMGAVYLNRNNYQIAKKYLLQAKEIINRLDIEKYKVSAYTNLAIVHTYEKEYDEALELHKICLDILQKNRNLQQLTVSYTNIGYLYDMQDKYEEAYEYYQKSYVIAIDSAQLYYEGGYALQNMLNMLTNMNKFDKAEPLVDELEDIVELAGSENLRAESYRTISYFYNKQGNYKTAFKYLNDFIKLHDSILNEDQNEKMAEMQQAYDISKRDATIAKIEKETALLRQKQEINEQQSKQRLVYMMLMGAVLLSLLAASVVLFWLVSSRSKALKELRASHDLIDSQNTEIELQNQALKLQNEHLEDLNREKDGLVGIVAHDLKSPINKSLALLELLKLQGPLNADQQKSVEMMERVARSGNALIRDLLEINAIESPETAIHLEDVDLKELLLEVRQGFEGEAKRKEIQLQIDFPQDLPNFRTDKQSVLRVMDNLVSNALKFSGHGTQVLLSAGKDRQGQVELAIKDQGPGISQEDQKRLFKKFQRLSAQPTAGESSTGLGLAIAKTLMEKLGGDIVVESQIGMGTTFKLKFADNN